MFEITETGNRCHTDESVKCGEDRDLRVLKVLCCSF